MTASPTCVGEMGWQSWITSHCRKASNLWQMEPSVPTLCGHDETSLLLSVETLLSLSSHGICYLWRSWAGTCAGFDQPSSEMLLPKVCLFCTIFAFVLVLRYQTRPTTHLNIFPAAYTYRWVLGKQCWSCQFVKIFAAQLSKIEIFKVLTGCIDCYKVSDMLHP